MEVGDRVIYYIHEASDTSHSSRDFLAFVVGVNLVGEDVESYDLVVFPPGGPLEWPRLVRPFVETAYLPPGGSYVREADSEPPDFAEFYSFYNHPEWNKLIWDQNQELNRTPLGARTPEFFENQRKQREELAKKLRGQSAQPEEEVIDDRRS